MLNTIQSIVDDNKNIQFILTGSSARKLKQQSANTLPGRLLKFNLYPLTQVELAGDFNLQKILQKGSLPEIYKTEDSDQLLENYVDLYLKEEVKAEALVRNMAHFSHFLTLMASVSWQEFNYTSIASDSEIPKETLRRYVDILEDTLIIHRIPGYTKVNLNRKAIQKEKCILFDIGVRNVLLGIHQNKLTQNDLGILFEHFVVLELIAMNSYLNTKMNFHYYRDQYKLEIDLVLENQTTIYAIEIKYGNKYKSDWKENLNKFEKLTLKKKLIKVIVYRGEHRQKDKDILILPYEPVPELII